MPAWTITQCLHTEWMQEETFSRNSSSCLATFTTKPIGPGGLASTLCLHCALGGGGGPSSATCSALVIDSLTSIFPLQNRRILARPSMCPSCWWEGFEVCQSDSWANLLSSFCPLIPGFLFVDPRDWNGQVQVTVSFLSTGSCSQHNSGPRVMLFDARICFPCLDEKLEHKLAGHAIDPDTFLHGGVLCLIKMLWEGKPSTSITFSSSHTSINFSGDRTFISRTFQWHRHARSWNRNFDPKITNVAYSRTGSPIDAGGMNKDFRECRRAKREPTGWSMSTFVHVENANFSKRRRQTQYEGSAVEPLIALNPERPCSPLCANNCAAIRPRQILTVLTTARQQPCHCFTKHNLLVARKNFSRPCCRHRIFQLQ